LLTLHFFGIVFQNLHFDHYQGTMVKVGNKILVVSGWRTCAIEELNLGDDFPYWKKISDAGCTIKMAGTAASKSR